MSTKIKVSDTRFPRITRAVLRRLDREQLEDVARHGADAGWSGFTYYANTEAFYRAHKADILAMAKADAQDLGQEMLEMIKGFRCLNGAWSLDEIAAALHSNQGDGATDIRNAMSWYALETVARELNPET